MAKNIERPFSQKLSESILSWYKQNQRDLPWRKNQDPYRIWISEIMLQQTTVQAVIPYYNRFLDTFPDIHSLANSKLDEVLPLWSGLGYYSRARNLHKAAQIFSQKGFAKSFDILQTIPGLGPYTARAISSFAFNEQVGVLDGNVIRILCRVYGLNVEWWKPSVRNDLQKLADQIADLNGAAASINQAMMELGAIVCTPKKTACNICPWQKKCVAFKNKQVFDLPLKKERKQIEVWYWKPHVIVLNNKIALHENNTIPFLKKSLLPPGTAKKLTKTPIQYQFLHTITNHKIYVQAVIKNNISNSNSKSYSWIPIAQLSGTNPSSLLQKILRACQINTEY